MLSETCSWVIHLASFVKSWVISEAVDDHQVNSVQPMGKLAIRSAALIIFSISMRVKVHTIGHLRQLYQ